VFGLIRKKALIFGTETPVPKMNAFAHLQELYNCKFMLSMDLGQKSKILHYDKNSLAES
jgi:hypothetical protein